MSDPAFKISLFFIALAIIFLAVALRDHAKTNDKTNPARQTWLRVSLIFAAVGIALALMHI
jgi:hypothetical protein